MDLRFRIFRSLCHVSWPLSVLAAAFAGIVIVNSFRMPPVQPGNLYRWSAASTPIGIGAIIFGILLGFPLLWLSDPFSGVNAKGEAALKQLPWADRVITAAMFALILSVMIPGFRYVHPEGDRWVATGKAKPVRVSAELATVYMWRNLRMDALFVLATAFSIGSFSWSRLVGIEEVLNVGEELVPKIKEHVRPRDWQPPRTLQG